MVGLGGLEPPTSRLSGGRSNQLSYRPLYHRRFQREDQLLAKTRAPFKLKNKTLRR